MRIVPSVVGILRMGLSTRADIVGRPTDVSYRKRGAIYVVVGSLVARLWSFAYPASGYHGMLFGTLFSALQR